MFVRKKGELVKISPEVFVDMVVKAREANPEAFGAPVTYEIPLIEITGDAAVTQLFYHVEGSCCSPTSYPFVAWTVAGKSC